MSLLDFFNSKTGAREVANGSDGRVNVSSRSDSRSYYNSRDESESYSVPFDDANASADDFVMYLKNDKTDGKHLIIRAISVNCEAATCTLKLSTVTGTAAGGAPVTPTNLNRGGVERSAAATALATVDSGVTPMSGLTEEFVIDHIGIDSPFGREEFRIDETLRLGQDQAIAIELDTAAAADVRVFGSIYFYFE